MSKIANKLLLKGLEAKIKLVDALKSERGDTNIISIIVILAIVIALAVIFRKSIMDLFSQIWGSLTDEVTSAL